MTKLKSVLGKLTLGILCTALAAGFTALPAQAQADWPEQQITFVVALGPGGSADRTARALARRMQEELGVPIRVVNQQGGGGHVGHTYFQNMPTDGSFFLATSIHPYISNAILQKNADYSLDDFAFINGQWTDNDVFAMNADLPFKTLDEFMQAVKEEPSTMRISVVPGSTGEINTLLMLEAYGVDRDAVNIVTYQSGSAARTAAAGGQVDMTVLGADGTLPMKDRIKALAVAADEPLPRWDAPTLNQVLADHDTEVPVLVGSMRGVAAHAAFRDEYPERYETFVEAYHKVLEDPEFVEAMESQQIGAEWLGPERTTEIIESNFDILERYTDTAR